LSEKEGEGVGAGSDRGSTVGVATASGKR